MTDETEKHSRRRRRLLIGMGVAFIVWQVAGLEIFSDFAGGDRGTVTFISLFAFGIWAFALVRLMLLSRLRGAPPETHAALNDELVQQNRARAFQTGYWVMLAAAALLFTLALFVPLEGNVAAQLILVAGVVAPMFSFARLEGRGA
jgi:hypothetical protein